MKHPVCSSTAQSFAGECKVPGDKSISHRSLMLASQAVGVTRITGLLEGDDVLHTASALRLMGVDIANPSSGEWVVQGVGVGGLSEPEDVLYMGNAGTGTRLMMGLVMPYSFPSFFSGDASLRKRPMKRIMDPLSEMGGAFISHSGGQLPLLVQGTVDARPISYHLPVPSAQVKSAVLLAGLSIAGNTTVIEPEPTRDHTELMLMHFGAEIEVGNNADGYKYSTLKGQPELVAKDIAVPGDPSSAAFLVVAALLVPGADLTIKHVCLNVHRTGLFDVLKDMGADITFERIRQEAGETVADIRVRHSVLKGVTVPEDRAPSMIDEYPILSIAASCAEGTTTMLGLEELKVKESDRLSAVANGLDACGVHVEVQGDSLLVTGSSKPPGGGTVVTHMDHRIAMAFLVLGMVSEKPVTVDDGAMVQTSFPGFVELMNALGADMHASE